MNNIKLIIPWIKKNSVKILLVLCLILVMLLVLVGFWFKIRGFKIANLIGDLQIANTKNEMSYLEKKKAVLQEKGEVKKDEIAAIEVQIKDEQRKAEKAKLEIQGLKNDEIADRLTKLGF